MSTTENGEGWQKVKQGTKACRILIMKISANKMISCSTFCQ